MTSKARDRIRKLLALSKGSEGNEADVAREMAERMLAAAGLSAQDLEDDEIDPIASVGSTTAGKCPSGWRSCLMVIVAKLVGGHVVGLNGQALWVGTEGQREAMVEMYGWLTRQLDHRAKTAQATARASGRTKAWLRAYRLGLIATLNEQVERLTASRTDATRPPTESALARRSAVQEAIVAYLEKRGLKTGYRTRPVSSVLSGAYTAGRTDGTSVRMQRDVAGGGLRLGSGS